MQLIAPCSAQPNLSGLRQCVPEVTYEVILSTDVPMAIAKKIETDSLEERYVPTNSSLFVRQEIVVGAGEEKPA